MLARSKEASKEMMQGLRRYLDKNRLELNAEKSKVIVFIKARGRDEGGKWKGKAVQEVKEFWKKNEIV